MLASRLPLLALAGALCIVPGDIALSGEPQTASIKIDAAAVSEPISPLLFSHNIEVTRRAVFGGLSAEMVSNRKFAALENGLPKRWSPTTASIRLSMDDRVTYAKRPSLRVNCSGDGCLRQQVDRPLFPKGSWTKSMLQDDYGSDVGGLLAFQKGRKYAFRWQLKTEAGDKSIWMRITDIEGSKIIGSAEASVKAGDWQTWTGEFAAAESADNARLEIGCQAAGDFWIGAASLQPSDAFHGMRRDVIALLKELKPGALRFPGGCYSDFYAWRDGLLPVDERPVISQGPLEFLFTDSDGYDTQELNTDDFIALCRELKCAPSLSVRLRNEPGEPEEAIAWIQYCNGGQESHWGKARIARGFEQPYKVRTWFVGNELAFFGRNGMNTAAVSAPRSRLFAEAMKKADPSIDLVGCTDFTKDGTDLWNKGLMEQAGEFLTYGSYHNYAGDNSDCPTPQSIARTSLTLGQSCQTLSKNIKRPVFLDEWNLKWGTKGTVAMALHTACMLNRLCRDSQELGIAQAYYFQPVNEGCIIVTPLDAKLDAAGKVFAMYKVHQGARRIKTSGVGASDDIDACASAADNGIVHVTAVNRNCDSERKLSLMLDNVRDDCIVEIRMLVPRSMQNSERELDERSISQTLSENRRVELAMPPGAIVCVGIGS